MMKLSQLRRLWRSYYSEPIPVLNRLTLINKIAYRIQVLKYGELSQSTINLLIDYGTGVKKKPQYHLNKPVAGTRLIREYNGVEHCVTVLTTGYEYRGHIYKSLSAITKHITGTNWNGKLFFGLVTRRAG